MKDTELCELDDWIAEHVMGFVRCEMGWQEWCPTSKKRRGKTIERLLFTKCFDAWKPTSDPAAAMQVLEKCAKKLFGVGSKALIIREYQDLESNSGFRIDDGYETEVVAETLPLAICQFAKKLFSK